MQQEPKSKNPTPNPFLYFSIEAIAQKVLEAGLGNVTKPAIS
tara:strand:+ start:579 stop:704 length:126 start_codon:yes stop_codon:yes gene_type:complete